MVFLQSKEGFMQSVNFKKEIKGQFEKVITLLTEELKTEGFGILTRIDLHEKFKEKLNKTVPAVTILGACNPALAYEVYLANSDVASLLPCNAVVRDIGQGKISIELAKPTSLMKILGDQKLVTAAEDADKRLAGVLERM